MQSQTRTTTNDFESAGSQGSAPHRPDAVLRRRIVQRLHDDRRLAANPIGVTVDGGVVRLRGRLGSRDARAAAARDVWSVPGVVDLYNELTVESPAALPTRQHDTVIHDEILDRLFHDPEVDPADLFVTVRQGIVILSGRVAGERARHAAAHDAWSVPGVLDVHNDLAVRRSDREIEADIQRRLRADPRVDATPISLVVSDGVANLTGGMPSYAQKQRAAADAWAVPGVVDVVNNMVVRPT